MLGVATNTGGPAFAIHGWFAWLFLAGVGATALVAIKALVWPLLKAGVHAAEMWPTLESIASMGPTLTAMAAQFTTNGGTSMRDAVDRIEGMAVEAKEAARQAAEAAQAAHQAAVALEGRVASLEDRETEIHVKVHPKGEVVGQVERSDQPPASPPPAATPQPEPEPEPPAPSTRRARRNAARERNQG